MYYNDFDHHLDRCQPSHNELLPARSGWARLLSIMLFGPLGLLHTCA